MSYSEEYSRRCAIEDIQESWNYAETLTAQYDEQTTYNKSIPRNTEENQGSDEEE